MKNSCASPVLRTCGPLATVLPAIVFLLAAPLFASTPAGGSISSTSPSVSWTGGPFTASNPVGCRNAEATCDHFSLTINAPKQNFVVTVRISPTRMGDDMDLFARDPKGQTIASSGNPSAVEELVLSNPPSGTYTIVVQPFVVVPGGSYSGSAVIGSPSKDVGSKSYHGAFYSTASSSVPSSTPAPSGIVPQLAASFNYVGRDAAEPTIAINRDNIAFYAASTFDFPTSTAPARLAHTLVMRSLDKGATWQPDSPLLLANLPNDEDSPTFAPTSLDPYVYMDTAGVNPSSNAGRVFSVDLDAACGANAIFSDNEGATWTEVPLFACNEPVNDHQTLVAATPPPGFTTIGYPRMLYFCYNQVADATCSRSNDGGLTFTPTAPAYTGADPLTAGSVCGSLTGHLAADSAGRIFLPSGNCGLPRVAISSDGGQNWTRVFITKVTPMADHEVTLAVDTADNIYAVWQDGTFRLTFLSVSRDHGLSWSTPLMITPPGVHETNFPTIAAGDPGRIAVLFPGSQSSDFTDGARPWNIYVTVSVNALDSNPTFTWTTANSTSDPVHRGDCGPGRCDAADGGSMFDFLDIHVSPADGIFWGTASDTCVDACITDPTTQQLRPGRGVSIRETKGPVLLVNR